MEGGRSEVAARHAGGGGGGAGAVVVVVVLVAFLGDLRAALIVTLAEEMPVNESLELTGRLKKEVALTPSGLIVNQVYPDHFPAGSPGARILDRVKPEGDPVLEPVVIRAQTSRSRRALNERNLARLRAELPLPKIFVPQLGPRELGDIARLVGAEIRRSA